MLDASLSNELRIEISDFLYAEASLLEDNLYDDWLDLFTEDTRYFMPIRKIEQSGPSDHNNPSLEEFSYYDEDKQSLTLRVQRLNTGQAHAEIPPSVTQRLITNVRVSQAEQVGHLIVQSTFSVFQERRGRYSATIYGKRRDIIRREGADLKIAERRIALAHRTLPSTISIFF